MELSYRIIAAPGEHDSDILAFFKANDHEFYPPIAQRRELTGFVQSIYQDHGAYILCMDGDKIAGLTTIIADHPEFLYYYQYVAIGKGYRQMGIASQLYQMVTAWCRERGVLRAIVKTWSLNKPSQAMFPKVGFYFGAFKEDDRDPGVHSYFYFRSFDEHWFQQPLRHLSVVGSGIAMINFAKTLAALTSNTPAGYDPLPFSVISDPGIAPANITNIHLFAESYLPPNTSHLLFTDISAYQPALLSGNGKVEVPDMLSIANELLDRNEKAWLVAGCNAAKLCKAFGSTSLTIPDSMQQMRINEIIQEISGGYISVGYYKKELTDIARAVGCHGLLLAGVELHSMFGLDRKHAGIEIFDPLTEIAFIIQNNRIGPNQD